MKTGLILVAMLVVGGPAAAQGYNFRYDGRDVHVPSGCADISCITTSGPEDGPARHRARLARPAKTSAKALSTRRAEARAEKATHAARLHRDHPHAVGTVRVPKAKVTPANAPEPADETPVAKAPVVATPKTKTLETKTLETKTPEIKTPDAKPAVAPAPVAAPVSTPTIVPSKASVSPTPSEPKAVAAAPKDAAK